MLNIGVFKNMKVFKTEQILGLASLLEKNTSVSIGSYQNSEVEKSQAVTLSDKSAVLNPFVKPTEDCLLFNSILVTTNWNKNDDIFTPDEMFNALHTPKYKPVNEEHQGMEGGVNKICGVIYDSYPVDDEYKYCMLAPNNLPSKYHILIASLIWQKYFPNAASSIKSRIEANKLFVSMECLFSSFGYGIRIPGSTKVTLISRNEDTSFLTQFLRMYGGKGTVEIGGQVYEIGRWLREFYFSGVGIVEKPANPESIIFQDYKDFSKSSCINFNYTKDDWYKNYDSFEDFVENCVLFARGNVALWPN